MDPVAMTHDTYDVIAAEYAARCMQPFPDLVADAAEFAAEVPDGWVADIGCGPGRDTLLLREHGLSVIGLDLSLAMLAAGGVCDVARADMRSLPVRSGCLSGVWCQAAMLHIPHAQVPGVLAEFSRVCRPGARLHLAVAAGDGESVEPDAYHSGLDRFFAYHRPEPLSRILDEATFDVTAIEHRTTNRRWLRLTAVRRH